LDFIVCLLDDLPARQQLAVLLGCAVARDFRGHAATLVANSGVDVKLKNSSASAACHIKLDVCDNIAIASAVELAPVVRAFLLDAGGYRAGDRRVDRLTVAVIVFREGNCGKLLSGRSNRAKKCKKTHL
jgi:hypothetical protein